MTWHRVAGIDDIAQGARSKVVVGDLELMLIHGDEGLYCIDYRCPHTGGPLGDGFQSGTTLTCPLHKWRFELTDGTHNHPGTGCPPAGVYPLKLDGEDILADLGNEPVPEPVSGA